MGNVVAAVEIVVDEHFPVAVQHVSAPIHPVQIAEAKCPNLIDQARAEKCRERGARSIDSDEHPLLPDVGVERHEPVGRPIEVAHAGKIGRAFQRAIERVGPPMIGAAERVSRTLRLGHDRGRVVAADVEKSTKHAIASSNDDDRLAARQLAGEVVACVSQLIDAPRKLPRGREDGAALQVHHTRIEVPRRRDCGRLRQRRLRLVSVDNLVERLVRQAQAAFARSRLAL